MDENVVHLNRKFEDMCSDFSELKKYVEQIAITQVRIEAVFVSQKEMFLQYNDVDTRITRVETYMVILGGVLAVLGGAVIAVALQIWII